MEQGRPSIWLNKFEDLSAWHNRQDDFDAFGRAAAAMDNHFSPSTGRDMFHAYCACCEKTLPMGTNYDIARIDRGKLFVGWSEAFWCHGCAMNSRMRATWDFLKRQNIPDGADVYMPEAITQFMPLWRKRFSSLETSEFLSNAAVPGSYQEVGEYGNIRHEDLTQLSFQNKSFDAIICQEVFEHIPDFNRAFAECARVLKVGGRLVFTVPFFSELDTTVVRAAVQPDGNIVHYLPPEYHGNPLSSEGSLCFQYFGWDMLDGLRKNGFASATAHQYWGPWQGHCGWPMFVFMATA